MNNYKFCFVQIEAVHCRGYRVALLASQYSYKGETRPPDLITLYKDVNVNIQQSLECLFKGLVSGKIMAFKSQHHKTWLFYVLLSI